MTHHHEADHSLEGVGPDDFSIQPEIPLPVELLPGEKSLNLEDLSWEMILAGMLKVLGAEASSQGKVPVLADIEAVFPEGIDGLNPSWLGYYRRFVLALRPDILPEFTEAAILKARNGDYGLALEIFTALRGLFPHAPSVLLNSALTLEERAEALERQGQEKAAEDEYAAAEQAYQEAMALEPPFPDAFFNAAYFYLKRRDFSRAKELFVAYLDTGPEEISRSSAADDEASAALEEKRENAQALIKEINESGLDDENFRKAWVLVRQGREEEGLRCIRDFLEQRPSVWNGWFILGWALRRLGRWEDAGAALQKALELGGDNGDTRNELAICLMEREDYPAARRELETALQNDPENVKIISNLGMLAMKAGDDDEAAAFFRIVLDLEPGDPVARQYFGLEP
jgi:Flp pilus assembly protein TadD